MQSMPKEKIIQEIEKTDPNINFVTLVDQNTRNISMDIYRDYT